MIPSMLRTPAPLSILAITCAPGASERTRSTSAAELANDSATCRMPLAVPSAIAARSLSVRAGSGGAGSTATPLCDRTLPPSTTTASAWSSPASRTRTCAPSKSMVTRLPTRRGGEADRVALAQGRARRHRAAAHLGAFEVQAERLGRGGPHQVDARPEPLERGVGQGDAEQVDARLVELPDDPGGQRRRAQRAQDLDLQCSSRSL